MKNPKKTEKTPKAKTAAPTKAKKLVVFYSRTGTTKKVAEELATALACEIEELTDKKNRKGLIAWFAAGKDAMKKNLTELEDLKKDISGYDFIIIGTPVWAGMPAPAVRAFLTQNKDKIKKVAFFCTMGGSDPKKALEELKQILGTTQATATATAMTLALLSRDVAKDLHADKVKEFARQLMS